MRAVEKDLFATTARRSTWRRVLAGLGRLIHEHGVPHTLATIAWWFDSTPELAEHAGEGGPDLFPGSLCDLRGERLHDRIHDCVKTATPRSRPLGFRSVAARRSRTGLLGTRLTAVHRMHR